MQSAMSLYGLFVNGDNVPQEEYESLKTKLELAFGEIAAKVKNGKFHDTVARHFRISDKHNKRISLCIYNNSLYVGVVTINHSDVHIENHIHYWQLKSLTNSG